MQSNIQDLFACNNFGMDSNLLNQTDKAIDLILNCGAVQILTSVQSVDIKIQCTLKEVKSNDVIIL